MLVAFCAYRVDTNLYSKYLLLVIINIRVRIFNLELMLDLYGETLVLSIQQSSSSASIEPTHELLVQHAVYVQSRVCKCC